MDTIRCVKDGGTAQYHCKAGQVYKFRFYPALNGVKIQIGKNFLYFFPLEILEFFHPEDTAWLILKGLCIK